MLRYEDSKEVRIARLDSAIEVLDPLVVTLSENKGEGDSKVQFSSSLSLLDKCKRKAERRKIMRWLLGLKPGDDCLNYQKLQSGSVGLRIFYFVFVDSINQISRS